jgi:hypothetical protein
MDSGRLLVVMAAMASVLGCRFPRSRSYQSPEAYPPAGGSASSPQQVPAAQAAQPQPVQPQWTACDTACAQLARCNLQPYPRCDQVCKASGAEQTAAGFERLNRMAQSSCQELASMANQRQWPVPPAQPPPAQPPPVQPPVAAKVPASSHPADAHKKPWRCTASGMWQKCDKKQLCSTQSVSQFAFGENEQLARVSAATQCSTAMTNLMIVNNINYTTSVLVSCSASTCAPP